MLGRRQREEDRGDREAGSAATTLENTSVPFVTSQGVFLKIDISVNFQDMRHDHRRV